MFTDYILSIAPETVQVKVTPMHGGQGYVCPISLAAYQAAEKGFEIAFGKIAVRNIAALENAIYKSASGKIAGCKAASVEQAVSETDG
jgi:hypothetical protein